MLPFRKAQWFLGCAGLSMSMEQDRQHWLLKTDRLKQFEDNVTGHTFQGQIENTGTDIILETHKLSTIHLSLSDTLFDISTVGDVLEASRSSLPFTYETNELATARIISTQYQYDQNTKKNFKIEFTNASVVYIPMHVSNETNDVMGLQFIRTTTAPSLLMLDAQDQFSIHISTAFQTLTNVVYYYPLDDFKPFDITDVGGGTYQTALIDDLNDIGYPAFWFTCDELQNGPVCRFNDSAYGLMHYGNPSSSKYQVSVYPALHEHDTPDGESVSEYKLIVNAIDGRTFTNTDADFTIPLNQSTIRILQTTSLVETTIPITSENNNVITMSNQPVGWTYVSDTEYELDLISIASNESNIENREPIIPVLNIKLDASVPFAKTTNDIGYAGIEFTTHSEAYPMNLNEWNGLPEWMSTTPSKQHGAIYAIHDTPSSSPDQPMSKQTAGLLFDPGKPVSESEESLQPDEIGRVYVLSNDDMTYENNATSEHPKPARTVARICDVPTSVMQLTNLSGVAPMPVVDPQYVRSQASYTESDQDRLYNTLNNRWVRPIHLNADGTPVCTISETHNQFIFDNPDDLISVDMLNYNDFREHTNLNTSVPASDVVFTSITDGGSGYAFNDIGSIVIGGFGFTYIVSNIDENGAVTELTVQPPAEQGDINLANFNILPGISGLTQPYGTSPLTGDGSGLKIQFTINHYTDRLPQRGNIYTGLYALVKQNNGIWLWVFDNPSQMWRQSSHISEFEESDPTNAVSTRDAYINSILPSVRSFPVAYKDVNRMEGYLNVLTTASFVNVIDKTKIPVTIPEGYQDQPINRDVVDINRYACTNVQNGIATVKTFEGVKQYIRDHNLGRFNSYLIWRWLSNQASNKSFEFGFVHLSFNNLQSTDSTTFLPVNSLIHRQYVETNSNTTMVWNMPIVGTMLWVFDPNSNTHESYNLNAHSRDLYVVRDAYRWEDIDIRKPFGHKINIVEDGKLLWNIASNKSTSETHTIPIYMQPDFTQNNILTIGQNVDDIPTELQPHGSWELVFPRIQSFTFRNDDTNSTYTPLRLNVLRGVNVDNDTDVLDQNGEPINYKTMIIDDSNQSTSTIKVYNQETGQWVVI